MGRVRKSGLAGAVLLASCNGPADQPDAPPTQASVVASLPVAEPPLDREALLLAVGRAASDFAAGRDDVERQRELGGKRFEVRLRVGCPGDAGESPQASFDPTTRVLRIGVKPGISKDTAFVRHLGYPGVEAVEGFWLLRPWLLEVACPRTIAPPPEPAEADGSPTVAAPAPALPIAAAAEAEVGIAQFYTAEDSRLARRDSKAFAVTVKLEPEVQPSATGYDLLLSGRLARLPDGRVIACEGTRDVRPSCIVSVSFDNVALAVPGGETLAKWTSG